MRTAPGPFTARGSEGACDSVSTSIREDLGGHVLGRELALRVVQLARRLVEPVGEDAEELPEHLDRELVLLAEDLEEVGAADGDELRRARRRVTRRRARDAADERHLADVLARARGRVSDLVAARHADLALEHDEELVALVALADDHVAVLVLAHLDRLHHAEELALGEAREERHVREHVALQGEALGARRVDRALLADASR